MDRSLIYSHILLYRFAMDLLYQGKYQDRFKQVIQQIPSNTRTVCELCFGDTIIAEWCQKTGITWSGFDMNPHFHRRAQKMGFDAKLGDILTVSLPTTDVYVMVGSLYHFHKELRTLFERVLSNTDTFIVSEPVVNLSSQKSILGWMARRSANPGSGHAQFRYTKETLLDSIEQERKHFGFRYEVVSIARDLILEIRS